MRLLGTVLLLAAVVTIVVASTYSPTYVKVKGKKVLAAWSPCLTITYAVNDKLAKSGALKDVKEAFKRISAITGLHFQYKGKTSEVPKGRSSWASRQRAAEIVIAWVKKSQTDLLHGHEGYGGWWYKWYRPAGTSSYVASIGRGFIVLDSAANKNFRNGFGKGVTRGAFLLHEIMHVLGLNHVTSKSQLMYPYILDKSHKVKFGDGDKKALAVVGRKRRSCYSVPSNIWRQL